MKEPKKFEDRSDVPIAKATTMIMMTVKEQRAEKERNVSDAKEEQEEARETTVRTDSLFASYHLKLAASNPFANNTKKFSSSKNPFARTAGMTRDRSMHKSNSFFDRVDASMESNGNTARDRGQKTGRTKQSTLFGLTKPKSSNGNFTMPTPSPAFADEQDNDDDDEGVPDSQSEHRGSNAAGTKPANTP